MYVNLRQLNLNRKEASVILVTFAPLFKKIKIAPKYQEKAGKWE